MKKFYPYFYWFLLGFILAFQIYFYQENEYETQLFQALAKGIKAETDSFKSAPDYNEKVFLAATNLTHNLVQNRMTHFTSLENQSGFKVFLQPVAYDLMTGNGACGSNSFVLARLLMELGYTIRIAQMGFDNSNGRHIITEVYDGSSWVVLDALYNLHFRNGNGKLASFNEISGNWNFYKNQVPANYDPNYNFHSVRYTNWEKIPVIFPLLKKILDFSIGKSNADEYCLRTFYLRKYRFLLNINFILIFLLGLIGARRYIVDLKSRSFA